VGPVPQGTQVVVEAERARLGAAWLAQGRGTDRIGRAGGVVDGLARGQRRLRDPSRFGRSVRPLRLLSGIGEGTIHRVRGLSAHSAADGGLGAAVMAMPLVVHH